MRHRPRLVCAEEHTPQGLALVWRVRCTCTTDLAAGFLRRSEAARHLRQHQKVQVQRHAGADVELCQPCLPGFEDPTTCTDTDHT